MALAALGVGAAVPPAAPSEIVSPAKAETPPVIKAGTPIFVEITENVSTRTVKRGDRFALKLAAPIVVEGRTIVPAGVAGVGEVIDAGKPGLGGKPAKLVLAARRLDFQGGKIALRSLFLGSTGADATNTALAVSFVPYVGLASIFIQGGHVAIPAGTLAKAKVSQDFTPGATTLVPAAAANSSGGE